MRAPVLRTLYCRCGARDGGQGCRCDFPCQMCKQDEATHVVNGVDCCEPCGRNAIATYMRETELIGDCGA